MLTRLGRIVDHLLVAAATLLLLAMLACVFLGVVFRALGQPLSWSDELGTYLLVWVGFTGWIIAGNHGSHIRITLLLNRLRPIGRFWSEVVIQLLVLAFGVGLLVNSFGLIQRNLDVMWVTMPLSVALVYVPIPITGLAVVCQSILAIVRARRGDYGSAPLEVLE